MATNKNGLRNSLKKLISARDKTNDKLYAILLESKPKLLAGRATDLNGLTLETFIDNYHVELKTWVENMTAPEEGSFRINKEINYDALKIFETIKYNAERGYFQLGEPVF